MTPDEAASPHARSAFTLVLSTVLHAFTHAYGTMLVPLYLLISADLRLGGVKAAALIVTVYGVVYNLGSYFAGLLADRFNRKTLLGVGLLGNAAAILLMGLTRRYDMLIALGVLAGVCGTLFHPAANAMIPAHFPKAPGMAIGLLGIGSGLGFFAGPQYAGWRADSAHWAFAHVADWQRPCIELGAAGLMFGILFLALAREAAERPPRAQRRRPTPLPRVLRNRVLLTAFTLGFRDFAGVAGVSLASIYLQKAHGLNAKQAGFIVGTMMLLSVFVNPLAVWLSPGGRRLPALVIVLIVGGAVATTIPFIPLRYTLAVLCAFQTCQMGSYAISDAAMLERVPAAMRGRVVGLFLTYAGTFASLGPWVMGWWTDAFGARGSDPRMYAGPFALLALFMLLATSAVLFIARYGQADEGAIEPLTEISPATMEVVG